MEPPTCCGVSRPAGRGLGTPAALRSLATAAARVWPAVRVTTLGVRHTLLSTRYQPFRGRGHPTASRMLGRRFAPRVRRGLPDDAALDARFETAGWLALTRQGRSPGTRRQAFWARSRQSSAAGAASPLTHDWGTELQTAAVPPSAAAPGSAALVCPPHELLLPFAGFRLDDGIEDIDQIVCIGPLGSHTGTSSRKTCSPIDGLSASRMTKSTFTPSTSVR
jgi:hypothetical protein